MESINEEVKNIEIEQQHERIDDTIQVRRVSNINDTTYSLNVDEESIENEEMEIEETEVNQAQDISEGNQQWESEGNNSAENEGRNDSDSLTDSATVLTLDASQQAKIIPDFQVKDILNRRKAIDQDTKFRFIPAKNDTIERAHTAPARPLTELEEFRGSNEFLNLESAAISAGEVITKSEGKLDLDSHEGHNKCKKFLNQIEVLATSFKAFAVSRGYRKNFTRAYNVLYQEGSLCYLAEILDSAQEGITNSTNY